MWLFLVATMAQQMMLVAVLSLRYFCEHGCCLYFNVFVKTPDQVVYAHIM